MLAVLLLTFMCCSWLQLRLVLGCFAVAPCRRLAGKIVPEITYNVKKSPDNS